jgi:long-chain acyl-CoA synthetase
MHARATADTDPDRLALVMAATGETVTFGDYEHRCNRFARLMRAAGLRRGDHVAFFMENNARLPECEGAAERIGLYFTLVNSHASPDDAAYIVDNCQARLVVTTAAKAEVAVQVVGRCPSIERWLMVDGAVDGFEDFEDAVAQFPGTALEDESAGRAMFYSSGTTGRPKGILRALPTCAPGDPAAVALDFLCRSWQLRAGMTYLSPAPLYHASPQVNLSAALRLGATSVIMERFDAAMFLDLVERFGVSHTQMVPTMFVRLLKLPDATRDAADVSSLESVVHAAAPCPVSVKRAMIDWWGPILIEYLGTSEGVGSTRVTSGEWLTRPGTVGRSHVGQVQILDDKGSPRPPGVPGDVWFTGDTAFEYFGDPAKTAAAKDTTGTRSPSGDIGYLDEDGFLFLTDRHAHTIISGGVNIYPQEIENLLVTHADVVDAAVIGVPNEEYGEEVKAVVETVHGVTGSDDLANELLAMCRRELAHYKCPRSVDFTAQLPRLATGKLYKRELRDRYRLPAEHVDPDPAEPDAPVGAGHGSAGGPR